MWARGTPMCTGVAMRLGGEACKGLRLTMVLGTWGWGLQGRRAHGGVAGPCPLEHDAQPHQGDQPQLVEKEMRDYGTPLLQVVKQGYATRISCCRISRRLGVHDPFFPSRGLFGIRVYVRPDRSQYPEPPLSHDGSSGRCRAGLGLQKGQQVRVDVLV